MQQQEKLKKRIIQIVRRRGLPVGTQYIADHVTLPEGVELDDVLTELVTEKRLKRNYTLLPNGDPDCIYNLVIQTSR